MTERAKARNWDPWLKRPLLEICNDCEDNDLPTDGRLRAAYALHSAQDDDLAAVLDAWPGLPEVIRVSIVAMIRAASFEERGEM